MQRSSTLFAFIAFLSACSGALDVGSNDTPSTPPGGSSGIPEQSSGVSPTCKPLGPAPIMLGRSFDEGQPMRPIAEGSRVWFVMSNPGSAQANAAALWYVDLAASTSTSFAVQLEGFTGGLYTLFGNTVAFVRTESKGASSLVLHDLGGGAEQVLPHPDGLTMVSALRGHPSGIYWSSRSEAGDGPIAVSRYTPGETVRKSLATMRNHSPLVTDGKNVFYTRYADDGSSTVSITMVPVDGREEPRPLVPGFDARKEYVQVVAANEQELFYTVSRLEGGGTVREGDIRATTKDGKTTRTIATGQTFGGIADVNVAYDPDYLTWVDGNAQTDIMRVKHAGGAVERVISGDALNTPKNPARYVNAVTADACNLFWTVVNPPALYGRSRLP